MYALLRFVPKNHLSALMGALARIPIARPLRRQIIGAFARLTGASLDEASLPLTEYRSVAEFFIRDLKPGIRPMGEGIVSPVDGAIRSISRVADDWLEQIKGKRYRLAQLLGGAPQAQALYGGTFINLYLAPPDYHHVHAPCDLAVRGITYIPGKLWPVNTWAFESVPELFSTNERVVIHADSEGELLIIVLVGATNVGRISLTFDPLITNSSDRRPFSRDYQSPPRFAKGERIGTFNLGSTVLLFLNRGLSENLSELRGAGPVRLGESIMARRGSH